MNFAFTLVLQGLFQDFKIISHLDVDNYSFVPNLVEGFELLRFRVSPELEAVVDLDH